MFGHCKKTCSALILMQHYSRLPSRVLNYKNPNLIFQRFQSGVETKEEMLDGVPANFLKPVSDWRSYFCFTINRDVAARIANKVITCSALKGDKKASVIEVNPGPGLITQELIKNDIENITVFCPLRFPYFTKWSSEYGEKINVICQPERLRGGLDMYRFVSHMGSDNHWVVIIILPEKGFLRLVMFQIIKFNWNYYEKAELFLVINKNVYRRYYSVEDQYGIIDRTMNAMLFDTEVLDKFKRSDFLPEDKDRQEESYLVRLRRRDNSPLKNEDARCFYYFLLYVLNHRRFVVEMMERWFPGSGPCLMANGVKVTQRVTDCTDEELLKIFYLVKGLGWDLTLIQDYSDEVLGKQAFFSAGLENKKDNG